MKLFWLLLCLYALNGQAQEDLTINQLQFVGSHNSYKLKMNPVVFAALSAWDTKVAQSLDYSHIAIDAQLEMGVRKLELDVFFDATNSALVVGHVQLIDMNSSCSFLNECFKVLLDWSANNAEHVPIWISFNAKDQKIDGLPDPDVFSDQAFRVLDQLIEEAFDGKIIWPRDIDGLNWPRVSDSRGKFIFVLDEGGEKRQRYLNRWQERPMFTTVEPPHPAAAILIINDPIKQKDAITDWVNRGFMVRTRADADTIEARMNLTERKMAALESGAQAISTDYYIVSEHFDSPYLVKPFIACNPVNTKSSCAFAE